MGTVKTVAIIVAGVAAAFRLSDIFRYGI